MTTTEGQTELSLAPVGAVPQPATAGGASTVTGFAASFDRSEALRLSSRSGDTEVIFRLNPDIPLWRQPLLLFRYRFGRLSMPQRVLAAGGLVVALGALALALPLPDGARPSVQMPASSSAAVATPTPEPSAPPAVVAPTPDPVPAPALARTVETAPPAAASPAPVPKPAHRAAPKRARAKVAAPAHNKQAAARATKKAPRAAAANPPSARRAVVPARW